ncbi:winged helix DNA-binding protein [Planomonospora sp. ID91781]|uniref:MarR family transcriptional regulator n=1 Tax=Planomonospora sphaerica TaxID=161355 RepID=A0A161LK67_9ACTN|nr:MULTISPECIES: MarR family transcriptional regulator [Planomonospora]MBG0823132.1 winged helix DNA-binding protein [Planomonospora sp. ID91781]GAT69504.1 marR family transcriptional regulator [Planomonospora sphaerica]
MEGKLGPEGLESLLTDLLIEMGLQRADSVLPGLALSLSEGWALVELNRVGTVHQQHIAARLQLEKSSASRLLAGLERQGWLTRERDPANRRYYRLALTAEGRAVADHIEEHLHERHARILARLDDSERTALAVGISALARAMRETTAHAGTATTSHHRGQERSASTRPA